MVWIITSVIMWMNAWPADFTIYVTNPNGPANFPFFVLLVHFIIMFLSLQAVYNTDLICLTETILPPFKLFKFKSFSWQLF